MDDFFRFEKQEATYELFCEAADQFERKAPEIVTFDEFVEIHAKQLGGNAQVPSEVERLRKADHAVFVVRILYSVSITQDNVETSDIPIRAASVRCQPQPRLADEISSCYE